MARVPLRIEESFEVEAPPALVWTHLGEPRELARCVSGVELAEHGTGPSGDVRGRETRALDARMLLRVGPVRLGYAGTMHVVERDDAAHRIRVRAEGAGDDGRAGLDATIVLLPALERRTTVRVVAELDVTGRVTQFGPGMIEGVARQLLRDFAACVRRALEGDGQRTTGGDGDTGESLTLSGAYREHPMLRDTLVDMRSPVASFTPPRNATAMPSRRETLRTAWIPRLWMPRLWRAALDRLRALGRPGSR